MYVFIQKILANFTQILAVLSGQFKVPMVKNKILLMFICLYGVFKYEHKLCAECRYITSSLCIFSFKLQCDRQWVDLRWCEGGDNLHIHRTLYTKAKKPLHTTSVWVWGAKLTTGGLWHYTISPIVFNMPMQSK